MPSANPTTPRPRDRAATEERILGAVGEVLARDGFGAVGVNAIARAAGVDKVLIYRYFGGMPELLRTWGASGRFWPSVDELMGGDTPAMMARPLHERYILFFERFIDALRARPLTVEILAAEIVERNELTAILEAEREEWGEHAAALLAGDIYRQMPHLRGVTLLLVAGVMYLLVRSRKVRMFSGIDLSGDAGWAALKAALAGLARQMLAPPVPLAEAAAAAAVGRETATQCGDAKGAAGTPTRRTPGV